MHGKGLFGETAIWGFVSIGTGIMEIPAASAAAAITTIAMSFIYLYSRFRETKRAQDLQDMEALTSKRNDRLSIVLGKMCKKIRRHEKTIKELQEKLNLNNPVMETERTEPNV